MTFTSGDPNSTYPSTSVRTHPFDGPEVFDDAPERTEFLPQDPWPYTSAAVQEIRARHRRERQELGYN